MGLPSNGWAGVLRKTLVPGAMIALGVAFLAFVGWQGAALLNHLLEHSNPIRIVTGFEGSPAAKVTKISNAHWVIDVEEKTWKVPHFFLFRVEGADGRTVTFEIRNAPDKWQTLNPVYTYAASLDDLATFSSAPAISAEQHKPPRDWELPDTSGQSWQFIQNAKWQLLSESKWHLLKEGKWRLLWQLLREGKKSLVSQGFSFTQKFDRDAYVCMRYPYTPGYNQRYLDSLTNNPAIQVITVGTSKEGRPLQVVKISEGGGTEEKHKPCVLIYAREHADEQDPSWAAQGAIEYLVSDTFKAWELRKQFTFLVIPMLDPDAAATGVYEHIIDSFIAGSETPESIAYSAFLKAWLDKGNPLQLVLNLHNVESDEGPHLTIVVVETAKERREYSLVFYNQFLQPLAEAEWFRTAQWNANLYGNRLGEWLSDSFGTLHMAFELNTQAQTRHLTIAGLHQIGKVLVLASARFLSSQEADPFLASIDKIRQERLDRWNKYGDSIVAKNAFDAETKCKLRADSDPAKWEAWRAEQLRKFH